MASSWCTLCIGVSFPPTLARRLLPFDCSKGRYTTSFGKSSIHSFRLYLIAISQEFYLFDACMLTQVRPASVVSRPAAVQNSELEGIKLSAPSTSPSSSAFHLTSLGGTETYFAFHSLE